MTSAAEKMAATKPWRREPRNKVAPRRKAWDCKVRAAREGLRLSLADVAKGIGMSVTALWQIEMGTDPMLTTAVKIADFFGLPISQLWPAKKRAKTG